MIVFSTDPELTDGNVIVGAGRLHLTVRTADGREFLIRDEPEVYELEQMRRMPLPGRSVLGRSQPVLARHRGHTLGVAVSADLAVMLTREEWEELERRLGEEPLRLLLGGGHVGGVYPYEIQLGDGGFEVAFVGVDEYGPCHDDPQVVCGFASFSEAQEYARELAAKVDWHDPEPAY